MFAVNSDDPVHGAYTFNVAGHSTQWHGRKAVVSSASTVYSAPQVAIAGTTIYVSYIDGGNGVKLQKSTDGGKTWSAVSMTGWVPTTSGSHSIAASGSNFHIFYTDTNYSPNRQYFAKSENYGVNPNNVTYWGVNTNYQGMRNSAVVLGGGNVDLCFNDSTNAKLEVAYDSSDHRTAGMAFTTHDVTGGTTGQTGGFHPSLKVVSGTAYVAYLDSKIVKFARSSNLSSWTYRTVYTDPTYNMAAASLVTDGTKGVILIKGIAGSDVLQCSRTTNSGDNWSAPDGALHRERQSFDPAALRGGRGHPLRSCITSTWRPTAFGWPPRRTTG